MYQCQKYFHNTNNLATTQKKTVQTNSYNISKTQTNKKTYHYFISIKKEGNQNVPFSEILPQHE